MKEIIIKFNGLGYDNINQAQVFIYDLYNNHILEKTTFNSFLKVNLKEKCFYKIIAKSSYEIIKKTIYISQNIILLTFSNSLINNNSRLNFITFSLTDSNYPNLPIKKGTMIFG